MDERPNLALPNSDLRTIAAVKAFNARITKSAPTRAFSTIWTGGSKDTARRRCRRSEASSVTAAMAQLEGRDAISHDIVPHRFPPLPGGLVRIHWAGPL
jgi:hypothetical protein